MIQPTSSYLNDVYFGWGRLADVASLAAQYGMQGPLLVTDTTMVGLGAVARAGLDTEPVFDRVAESSVLEAAEQYGAEDCDGLVAIGGGSPIDLAKGVALAVRHEGPLSRYAILEGGPQSIQNPLPPIIAVPSTAGSGSEVGRAALITVNSGRKLGFLSPKLLPVAAVCDPEFSDSMPATLAAATGMDAISHCIEAILSPRENPVVESMALQGLRVGARAITRVCDVSVSKDDRAAMMWCSLYGGLAFQKGLGVVHSLSHPLGRHSSRKLHHGTLNALFLPAVLRFNAPECADKLSLIASAVGGADPIRFFGDLLDRLQLPRKLAELGVTDAELVSSAPLAEADHCTGTNPRSFTERGALALYRECL